MRHIIKKILKEHVTKEKQLILEKRIAQISHKMDVTFMFDVAKTTHSYNRAVTGRTDLEDYNSRPISNREVSEVIRSAKDKIAEKIVNQEIISGEDFVIKSYKWELSMAVATEHVENTYWKLIVKTVFREDPEHHLFVGEGEVVIWVD